MDEQRARATASSPLEAPGARRRDPPRVQLRASTLRLFRSARCHRNFVARARQRRAGRVSRPRRVSGVGLVGCARASRARVVGRQRRPVAVRVRRPRRHDRPPRHRRRPPAPLARGQRFARCRHRGSERRHVCAGSAWETRRRRAARHRARRHPRRRPWPARGPRRRTWRGRAPDSHCRLAARRQGPVRGLFADGPADRRARAGGRPERRRRRTRRSARRARRRRRSVRCVLRRSGCAGRRRRRGIEHARRHASGERRTRRPRLRQHLRPGRVAGGTDGWRSGPSCQDAAFASVAAERSPGRARSRAAAHGRARADERVHFQHRGAGSGAAARLLRAARLVLHAGRAQPRRRPCGARAGRTVAREHSP